MRRVRDFKRYTLAMWLTSLPLLAGIIGIVGLLCIMISGTIQGGFNPPNQFGPSLGLVILIPLVIATFLWFLLFQAVVHQRVAALTFAMIIEPLLLGALLESMSTSFGNPHTGVTVIEGSHHRGLLITGYYLVAYLFFGWAYTKDIRKAERALPR